MFKLVALLFLVTNGVTADDPAKTLKGQESFPTEEACTSYFETNKEQAVKEIVGYLAKVAPRDKFDIGFQCVEIEDNTI